MKLSPGGSLAVESMSSLKLRPACFSLVAFDRLGVEIMHGHHEWLFSLAHTTSPTENAHGSVIGGVSGDGEWLLLLFRSRDVDAAGHCCDDDSDEDSDVDAASLIPF